MLYAILCYDDERTVTAWTKEEDAAAMARLAVVLESLEKEGRLGPVARLLPTSAAKSVKKKTGKTLLLDGPFAETKEQLLGFYLVECADPEQAAETARALGEARGTSGTYELRPVGFFRP